MKDKYRRLGQSTLKDKYREEREAERNRMVNEAATRRAYNQTLKRTYEKMKLEGLASLTRFECKLVEKHPDYFFRKEE